VTVRAQDSEVLEPIVDVIAIDVVEHQGHFVTAPLTNAALAALRLEQALRNEPTPELG